MNYENGHIESSIETRSGHLERWLARLPYADGVLAAESLQHALKETNKQAMKPSARMTLLECYARAERRLIDLHVLDTGQTGPHSIEGRKHLIESLRRVATELAFGAKLVAHDTLTRGFGFSDRAPPTSALVMAMRHLGHAMVLNFHEYAPPPKNLWREVHMALRQAEELGVSRERVPDPAAPAAPPLSVLEAYHQLAATAIADPHRLPYGTAWRVYEMVRGWAGDIVMGPYTQVGDPNGFFAVDLRRPEAPVSYTKFRADQPSEFHRLIDCNPLQRLVQREIERLEQERAANPRADQDRALLYRLLKAWSLPPRRYFPRQERSGLLNVVCGLDGAWRMFSDALPAGARPPPAELTAASEGLAVEQWNFVNEGPGGYAICNTVRPKSMVHIGDLVAIEGLERPYSSLQALGVVRWLMVQRNSTQLTGVQIIARAGVPVTVEVMGEGPARSPGFLVSASGLNGAWSLVTRQGAHREGRAYVIARAADRLRVRAERLLESTGDFDHFVCTVPGEA